MVWWRTFLIVCVVSFFLWIFDQNIPFAGKKNITYNPNKLHGAVSELYPLARVLNPSQESQNEGRTIIEDPIYFDVRTRVAYRGAHLKLSYQNTSSHSVSLGMRIHGSEAKNILAQKITRDRDGVWETVEADFDLSVVPLLQNKYTFLISIPGLEYEGLQKETILAHRINITLWQ